MKKFEIMVHMITDIVVSSDGGTVCIPAHAEAALGGVPVQVLWRSWIQFHSIHFQVNNFRASFICSTQNFQRNTQGCWGWWQRNAEVCPDFKLSGFKEHINNEGFYYQH